MSNQEINRARWVVGIAMRVLALALITAALISFAFGWSDWSQARSMMNAGLSPRVSILTYFRAEWTILFIGIALPLLTALLMPRLVPIPRRLCAKCGYDVKNLPKCPECGEQG